MKGAISIRQYTFKTVSSLEKVFPGQLKSMTEVTCGTMLKNEIHSFQMVCALEDDSLYSNQYSMKVESELAPYIKIYEVGKVPVTTPVNKGTADDGDYLFREPGLAPDPLYRYTKGGFVIANGNNCCFWISVEPEGKIIGTWPIVIRVFDYENNQVGQVCYELEIIDAELPKLSIYNTAWFHGDCIASQHGVEILSDAWFDLVDMYMDVYAKFGHNLILTPVFTPPLDTNVGAERPTTQLVDVVRTNGQYSFGFDNLKRWTDLTRKNGIEFIEISHLFTQWGAKHCPKIMATVDGEYKRIFGWDTDAVSKEYEAFLDAFLPALIQFLTAEGIMDKCLFHVSDEPHEEHREQYAACKTLLTKHLDENCLIDALSKYEFYTTGVVKTPVVCNDHIQPFLDNPVESLWTYYCCSQREKVANRFMAMPSHRNRVLGAQLYKYNIKGFLQWGFNFWYSTRSQRVINPYTETAANDTFPAGDAFVVYPKLPWLDEPTYSMRLFVFNEAMQDFRALKLLESLIGREEVLALLTELKNFDEYPRNGEFYIQLRDKINRRIQVAL